MAVPYNYGVVDIAASATLTQDGYAGHTMILSNALGVTVTLPAAAGTGDVYEFVTSDGIAGSHVIKAANATDTMTGMVTVHNGTAGNQFKASGASDTITMNGSTTGSDEGCRIRLTDYKTGGWSVSGELLATGTVATPFSATVS